jgi:hypothetical protein
MRPIVLVGVTCLTLCACAPRTPGAHHQLAPTGRQVRFAPSREAFYRGRFVDRLPASAPMICAGFVHHKAFGQYLRYGEFTLEMTMKVFLGGSAVTSGGRITGWNDGRLLRTVNRKITPKARTTAYVWCGRLRQAGQWKVGAMQWSFWLRGPERTMDEPAAEGTLEITP